MAFDALPVELYEAIFGFLTYEDLKPTVLAVSRAIPLSPVPLHHLYHQICVRHPDQAIRLHHCLSRSQKKGKESANYTSNAYSYLDQIALWIYEISIESWVADAEVVINIFRLLRRSDKFRLQSLNVWIGPSNFAPEHLEELFTEPLLNLRYLSLRFRPYVQRATYMQFLKGTYFDSTLKAITSWPCATFPALSIIQDPFDATIASEKRSFAQPLVFFRLDVASFMRSPALSSVTSLRFRIPARPVARALCNAPPPPSASRVLPLPDLEFLDLSSSAILENEIDLLLVQLPFLKHVVLDDCNIFRGEQSPSDWRALGKRCALIGVQRSKEREKALKEYIELRDASRLMGEMNIAGGAVNEGRKVKPGRRGLATATLSFRGPEVVIPTASRPPLTPKEAPVTVPPPAPPITAFQGSSLTPQKTDKGLTPTTPQAPSTKPAVSKTFPSLVSASLQDIQAHYDKKTQQKKKKALPVSPRSAGPKASSVTTLTKPSIPHPVPLLPPNDSSQDVQTVLKKIKPNQARNKSGTSTAKPSLANKAEKVRVLPSLPSLVSLCTTLPSVVGEDDQLEIRDQFEEGWAEGVKQLEATRARLRTSAANGVRVMRFAVHSDPQSTKFDSSDSEESDRDSTGGSQASPGKSEAKDGLQGLVDVDRTDPDAFGTYAEGTTSLQAPILCFGGPGRDGQHVHNCGHSVAWKVMKDDA